MRKVIQTEQAPQAIGTYSQAVRVGDMVFLSGQIPLDPTTGSLIEGDMTRQIKQVFDNLSAVCNAAGGSLADIVKLNIYLIDLKHFPIVNQIMEDYFDSPYPARAAVGVAALPKAAQVEAEAIMVIDTVYNRD